jgi:hypothetical protein
MSQPVENSQAQPSQQSDKEYNFAQLRKQLEQEKQARLQTEQRLAQIEQERQQPKQSYATDDDDSDEPYVDKKALRREFNRFGQDIEKKIDQKAEEKARILLEQERQHQFYKQNPDFNQIMTPDMIQKFAEKHPDTAESLLEMPDGFARQKLLYRAMKDVGIHKPPEAPKPNIQDAINNNRKPLYYQPSQTGSPPPYAAAGDFSPAGQKSAYDKMKSLINNRRS